MASVFVTQPIPEAALARLRQLTPEVEIFTDADHIIPRERLLRGVAECDILYCMLHDRIDREVINAGSRLKLIATSAINPANVDVAHATARRIPVTVIPNIVAEATADLQWALLMAAARRVVEADRAVREGRFPGAQSMRFVGAEVFGSTLGTVGLGAIGRGIAERARGFRMRVLYTKRHRLPEAEERALGVSFASLDDLLSQSDFVVINASYHPGTHHLIGARELSRMKPTAYLVNTARGPIVDEAALAQALVDGRIAGAGLDVYEQEPHVSPALMSLPNVVLTPHIGSAGRTTRDRIAQIVVDNVAAFLRGERPTDVVNPQVFE